VAQGWKTERSKEAGPYPNQPSSAEQIVAAGDSNITAGCIRVAMRPNIVILAKKCLIINFSALMQVLDTCLAAGVPVAGYVGGGYSEDLDVLARRHCWLHRAAQDMWRDYELG
jgi:type III secretion system FlhB-like substrate exporter